MASSPLISNGHEVWIQRSDSRSLCPQWVGIGKLYDKECGLIDGEELEPSASILHTHCTFYFSLVYDL